MKWDGPKVVTGVAMLRSRKTTVTAGQMTSYNCVTKAVHRNVAADLTPALSHRTLVFTHIVFAGHGGSPDLYPLVVPVDTGAVIAFVRSERPLFCPGGTSENSPAFQRWVQRVG